MANKTGNISLGKSGEDLACAHLIKNGYRILYRNHREGSDEIDIVAKKKDNTLIFVEVKTFADKQFVRPGLIPEDNMTDAKIAKLKRGCQMFVAKHPDLVHNEKGWQIDVLALTINGNNYIINHYENI